MGVGGWGGGGGWWLVDGSETVFSMPVFTIFLGAEIHLFV